MFSIVYISSRQYITKKREKYEDVNILFNIFSTVIIIGEEASTCDTG